jgi:hypothetical protein
MEMITPEQIDNANISNDAKLVLKIISPVLSNIKTINLILENIVKDDEHHYKIADSIREILIGPQDKLNLGEGPGGIKGDISKIIKTTSISNNLQSKDINTIEDIILYIEEENEKKFKELSKILLSKTHWTKSVQGIKDLVMTIGLAITALLTIYGTFIK